MRLTLRTLLAYLDGILDPPDARDLERKIAESELATQLIARIRSLQADRDGATGRLGGADANDVANYLDNTMPPQRVSDFERICLDSDAHLAEVAACHQILTRVLAEEMKTPASLRRRLVQLSQDESSGGKGSRSKPVSSAAAPANGLPSRPSRESLRVDPAARAAETTATASRDGWDADEHWTTAPDYLKQSSGRAWKSLATIAAISLCLLVAALRGMGPFNQDHPLAHYVTPLVERWSGRGARTPEVAVLPADATPAVEPPAADPQDDATHAASASFPPAQNQADDAPTPSTTELTPPTTPVHDPESPAAEPAADGAGDSLAAPALADTGPADTGPADTGPAAAQPAAAATRPDAELATETAGEEAADGMLVNPLADSPAPAPMPETASQTPPGESLEEAAGVSEEAEAMASRDGAEGVDLINPLDDAQPDDGGAAKPPTDIAAPEKITDEGALGAADGKPIHLKPKAVDPAAVDLGRFLHEQQVLLHGQSTDATWQRLAPGDRLQVGQQLLSLPTFRPPILLESGLQVSLIGATRVEVLPPEEDAVPRFGLHFGRLAVAAFTSEGSKFGLQWGADQKGTLTVEEMTSVSLELTHRYLPGDNPETTETPPYDVLMLYVTSGSAVWERAGAEPLTLPAGTRLVQVNDREPLVSAFNTAPAWIDGRDARPRDPIAAQDLGTRVTLDRPATQTLRELAGDRRLEVRSLAACSLAYTGDLDPLLDALGDAKLRSYWPVQYEVLLHRMNLGPDSVREVRDALRRRHGNEDGEALYRMLLGFSPQQLAEGGAATLVDYLDHPLTEFRFAANETLRAITGLPSLYQAQANERQRRPAVAKWRTHLQQNKIAYVEPPELVRFLNTEVAPPSK